MAYVQLDENNNVIATFGCRQPDINGFAEIPDNDLRLSSFYAAQQTLRINSSLKMQLTNFDAASVRAVRSILLALVANISPDANDIQILQGHEASTESLRKQIT